MENSITEEMREQIALLSFQEIPLEEARREHARLSLQEANEETRRQSARLSLQAEALAKAQREDAAASTETPKGASGLRDMVCRSLAERMRRVDVIKFRQLAVERYFNERERESILHLLDQLGHRIDENQHDMDPTLKISSSWHTLPASSVILYIFEGYLLI